jgi:hypothetical protein
MPRGSCFDSITFSCRIPELANGPQRGSSLASAGTGMDTVHYKPTNPPSNK